MRCCGCKRWALAPAGTAGRFLAKVLWRLSIPQRLGAAHGPPLLRQRWGVAPAARPRLAARVALPLVRPRVAARIDHDLDPAAFHRFPLCNPPWPTAGFVGRMQLEGFPPLVSIIHRRLGTGGQRSRRLGAPG
jgi:hypothetical protein